jgi:hypothetical protein
MSEAQVELLFDEFATRYLRGEHPDVGEYLERAGLEREELGRVLDRFLEAVPARASTEEDIVLIQARLEHEPPIFLLRLRRKLTREAIVAALTTRLRLDPAKSGKVERYYHDLEVGLLDPEPVDRRVWEVLADVLEANVRGLAGLRLEPPAAPAAAYLREPSRVQAKLSELASAPAAPADEAPDEIDRLFTGSGER